MTVPFNGRRPTVVVIGAGFGGLSVVKALRKAPVRVVLLDRNNYHLFQPLLYQVGTALLDPTDIATPIRPLIRDIGNAEFRLAEVMGVDHDRKVVQTDHGDVAYDYLVVSAGAKTNFFGNANIEEHSIGLKNLDDALILRNELIRRFELAKWVTDGIERRRLLSFVVVGGGSTGVETAGAIIELAKYVMEKDYKALDIRDVSVTLLEASDTLLAPYDQKLRNAAHERLKWMGIKVLRSSVVTKVEGDLISLGNGNEVRGLLIWTAGVRGEDIGAALSPRLGRQARVPVNSYLQVTGRPEVFCIGDLAEIPGPDGRPLPMLGPVATQSGKHAAKNILAHMRGKHLEPFRYWDKGTMSTIGRNAAIVQVGKLRITGFIGWLMWLMVHVVLIEHFRGQIGIVTTWFWHYLTNDRPARLLDGRHHIPGDRVTPDKREPENKPAPRRPRRAAKPAAKDNEASEQKSTDKDTPKKAPAKRARKAAAKKTAKKRTRRTPAKKVAAKRIAPAPIEALAQPAGNGHGDAHPNGPSDSDEAVTQDTPAGEAPEATQPSVPTVGESTQTEENA